MTVIDVLGSLDELADGMGGSMDPVTGAAIGPYRESRLKGERVDASGGLLERSCEATDFYESFPEQPQS